MSKFSNSIEFNLRTTLDASGITQLQGQLASISTQLDQMESKKLISPKEVYAAQRDVKQLGDALSSSLNPQTGLLDLSKFQKQLGGLSLSQLEQSMSKVGATGQQAFGNMIGQIGRMDTSFKSISGFADKIFNTMGNTVRWGVTASIFQTIQNSLYRAVDYVQELDTSLNNIRIVTNASNEDMRNFALNANQAAQALGSSTTSFTDAAQLYAQNGFNEEDYTRLAEITQKVANVTQQNTTEVSEQITALMEGYGMSIDQVEDSLSGMSVVAAASAADLEELATAEQKVASTASTLGVSQEQLTAQIGTIVSVTRQAPETVGNAMRTLYARIADLKMGDTLEDGVTLGDVSKQLSEIGVQVLDEEGNLRNLGDVLEDLQAKWGDLSNAQQIALGTTLAGKYQLNPFMALMENADMYNDQLKMMTSSAGALDEQQAIYADSMQAKLQKLSTAGEGIITNLLDPNEVKPLIDALTDLLNLITQIVDALGGLWPILTGVGAAATKAFSNQIGQMVTNKVINFSRNRARSDISPADVIKNIGGVGEESQHKSSVDFINTAGSLQSSMSVKQQEDYNTALKATVTLENQIAAAKESQQQAQDDLKTYIRLQNDSEALKVTNAISPQGKPSKSVAAYQNTLKESLTGIDSAIDNTRKKIQGLQKDYEDLKNGVSKNVDAAQRFKNAIKDYSDSLEIAGVDVNDLKDSLSDMSRTSDPQILEGYIKKIQELLDKLQTARENLANKVNETDKYVNNVNKTKDDAENYAAQLRDQTNQNALKTEQFSQEKRIQTIVSMAGAIGQLVFVVQTFHSLGSIWANDDLSDSEKMAQIFENLLFTVPALLSSVSDLTQGIDTLRKAYKAAQAASAAMSAAQTAEAATATAAASETSLLTGILIKLKAVLGSNMFLPLLLGIAAVSAAIAFFSAKAEEAKQKSEDIIETGQKAASSLQASTDALPTYRKAYKEFKETGEVTEELKSSITSLAKAYGLSIDTDNLKADSVEKINEALERQADMTNKLAHDQVVNAQREIVNKSENKSDGLAFKYTNEQISKQTGATLTDYQKAEDELTNTFSSFTRGGFVNNADWYQKVGDLADATTYVQEKVQELQLDMAGASEEEQKAIQSQIDAYNDVLEQKRQALGIDSTDLETLQSQQKTLADTAADYIGNSIDPNKVLVDDARQKLLSNADISAYVEMLGEDAGKDYVDGLLTALGYSSSEVENGIKDIFAVSDDSGIETLKSAQENKSSLESLINQYKENGNFTEDEAASLVAENPDYINYLTKVGDAYALNENALADWNDALKEQKSAMDALMDTGYGKLEQENSLMRQATPDFGTIDTDFGSADLGDAANDIETLNSALANGEVSVDDYTDGISNLADKINDLGNIASYDAESGNTLGLDEDEIKQIGSLYETVGSSIQDVAQQTQKAFDRGEISLSDYLDTLGDLARASAKVEASMRGMRKEGDKWIATTEDGSKATDETSKAMADSVNETNEAGKQLEELGGVFDSFTNDGEDLIKWFGEFGTEINQSAIDEAGSHYTEVMNTLSNAAAQYYQQNADVFGQMITNFNQTADESSRITQSQISELTAALGANDGSFSSYLQGLTATNSEFAAAMVSNLLGVTEDQVAAASSGVSSFITGVEQLLSSFSVSITGTPVINNDAASAHMSLDLGGTGILGGLSDVLGSFYGDLSIPSFRMDIGTSDAKFGDKAAASESIARGMGNISKVFGSDGAGISDWLPKGGGGYTPPSSYGNPGGRSSGGGSGSGGNGGSGGSGGGSGSSYEPKTKEQQEDEIDRYERVNSELDTLSNRLDKVAEEQDRLAGFDVADNISEQIGLIKEQIKWENEKLKIQKQEAQEYRDQLASQYGIAYDAEGHITNYAETYKRLLDNLNGLINQYNATTTEEGQEALDKQIEAAQDNFDKYNDLIEKYDKLNSNSILETEKDIEDFYDKIEDLQIEAFQKAVDAVDNIKDLQESLIDFNAVFTGLDSDSPFRDMITSLDNLKTYWDVNTKAADDYYDELIRRNKEAMKNASAQRKQELQYQNEVFEAARKQYGKQSFEAGGTGLFDMAMSNLNTILDQIRQYEESGTSTIFGENAGSMYEVGNDIFKQATELLSDYEGHLDDLKDAILDAIDEIGDKMDERLDTYKNINDELDHYADMIEMVQGENAYDQLNQTSQAMINNNQAQINELKQNIALWQDMLAAMEEGSDEWKAINEYITDAQQDLLELTSDTVEKMLDVYERGVNKILDKWVGSTGMGDDLDWISEEWELINRNADYYLDDVNAAYEIQKLQGKYLDLLDDSNGLDIQNQITQQMQQQLGYLREKDKLSEYDVQYANAQLEILQKTIALQEAQRNKSQLQLRRDTQGNYSYVYTADENDTRAAQSDLLDAQNNAYNLSKDQMKQTQDDSLSALQDARDTLEQIWTNANLTLEEKTKRTQTIIDSLKDYLAGTSEQLSESEKNIINDFLGMCEVLTNENDSRLQEIYDQIVNGNKDAFDQIDTRWQTSITNWLQHMEDFNTSTDESFQNLIDNFGGYQENLDELGNLAGMTFDDMSDSIQNAVDKTNDLANSTADFINQLKNDAGTVKEYEKSLAEMTAKIQDAENGMRAYQEQVNKLQSDLTEKEQENANLSSQVKDLQSQIDAMNNPAGAGGDGSGEGGGANTDTAWGIARAIWTYGGASGWGNDPIRSGKLIKAYGKDFAQQVQSIINQNTRSGKLVDYGSMKYSSYNLIGYKQGGYLGNRFNADEIVPNSDGGKLFIGHPGELILNQDDTANILNAVDMVRTMVAAARNGDYNDIIRQSGGIVDMDSIKDVDAQSGATYYQVECTFPNATGVDEIQKAILTLPDIAPQYAYKS